MQTAIIGGGAAGFFAAINIKRLCPSMGVTIYESGRRPLAKVALTGGGRCNLTNTFAGVVSESAVYPRGARLMKRLLREFSHADACRWFEDEGVRLVAQPDCCVFPKSQDAMEIVLLLQRLARELGVGVQTGCRVERIDRAENGNSGSAFTLSFAGAGRDEAHADAVLVAMGGIPRLAGFAMFERLGLKIESPVPSLFSFCIADSALRELMGIVVEGASVSLAGTRLRASGPLLITHWGMSGPAILKLSSHAARELSERGYCADISVCWLGESGEEEVRAMLSGFSRDNSLKMLRSVGPSQINSRLWVYLLQKAGLSPESRWGDLKQKGFNRLVNILTNDVYAVSGKNRFKEEFVTCGGVSLSAINSRTMECKSVPGLFFAGEVTDVDAVTGGFNLQAAWSMAYVASKGIVSYFGQQG